MPADVTTTSTDLFAFGSDALSRQPFSAMLNARLDAFASGIAELSVPVVPGLLQQHGFVHGGVLSYLADNALTFAGGSVLGDSVTAEFKINYLRPAKDAERLLAVATVVGSGKTQAVCRCDIFVVRGAERTLCAAAQGTIRKAG
jgi:uncharacterized protein (TIGR00369 family)